MNYSERKTLKSLRNDPDIKFVNADKGKGLVIIETEEYKNKIKSHLDDENTYEKLKQNPTDRVRRGINKELEKLKQLREITDDEYKRLYVNKTVTPRFYATIKTHKIGYPIRPIVNFINSPSYALSQFLSKILTPITESSQTKLNNSFEIRDFLADIIIPDNHSLISYDVKALFTSIPQDLALTAIKDTLDDDDLFEGRTRLSRDNVLKLVKLCLNSNYFQYDQIIYKQKTGTPMGSPISTVIAELTMQYLEKQFLPDPPIKPLFWKRYVDDVITALPKEEIPNFSDYINGINSNIQFTHETETNETIPYLDLQLTRTNNGILKFHIYRKPTDTGSLLDFYSYHHQSHKRSVAKSLFHRIYKLCSPEYIDDELKIAEQILKKNNFPFKIINQEKWKISRKFSIVEPTGTQNNPTSDEPTIKYVSTPYIQGTSERIQHLLKPFNITLSHKPTMTIKSQIIQLKDQIPTMLQTCIVYKLPCDTCTKNYIGETGRNLHVRMTEHQRDIRNQKPNSQVYQHHAETGHSFKFEDVEIIHKCQNTFTRRVLESYHTHIEPNSINRAYDVNQAFIPLVDKYLTN